MLSKKYDSKITGDPAIGEAYEKAKPGKLMFAGGHWYWIGEDKKEKVKSSDFEFLTLDEKGSPWETFVTYEKGEWKAEAKNVENDLGHMSDMVGEVEEIEKKLISDTKVLELVDNNPDVQKIRVRAPHLRISSMQFSLFDVDLEKPVWRVELKNWPLISYLKRREQPKTIELVVDGVSGQVLSYNELEM